MISIKPALMMIKSKYKVEFPLRANSKYIYARRWYIFDPSRLDIFNISYNEIVGEDNFEVLHQHPYSFWTYILEGSYTEYMEDGSVETRNPGDHRLINSCEYHRVRIADPVVKTINFIFPADNYDWHFKLKDNTIISCKEFDEYVSS